MSTTSSDVKDITEEPEYKLRDAEEEAGLRPPASDAVKAAITYPQTGFPVNTPDGHVMATKEAKVVNAKGEEVPAVDHPNLTETHAVLKAEDGTILEPSSGDPMVMVAEGTNEKEAEAAKKAEKAEAKSSAKSSDS